MRLRAEGFRETRLRQAREVRGISQTALARMVEVSPQSISLYESGRVTPGPSVLERIAQRLSVPFAFFFEPVPKPGSGPVFFRSLSAATKSVRLATERQYEWLVETSEYLQRFVRLPAFDVPQLGTTAPNSEIALEEAEATADECRRMWGLGDGPISNVLWLVENHGCVVARFAFGAETLDALSRWNDDLQRGFILLNADKASAVRSRFDTAHELGHLVLHRHLLDRDARDGARWRSLEDRANRFSGAFLLPARSFIDEFVKAHSIQDYVVLKEKWGCSLALMFRRAKDLEIFTEQDYVRMAIMLGRRQWRTREPLDNSIVPEEPQLLRNCFHLIVDRGVRTIAAIRQDLWLPTGDVAVLSGIEPAFFSEMPPSGEMLELGHPAATPDEAARPRSATILPLRREPESTEGGGRNGM